MKNDNEFDTTKSVAEAALAAMLRHAVPPTPRNYALWYAHVSGAAPELSRTVDTLISSQARFTAAQNEDLLDRFLGPDLSLNALEQTERLRSAEFVSVVHS